jgi:hypothetical protein
MLFKHWRCAPLFHGGDRPLQLLVSVLTRNALYGSWFNRPPGICPCPLYTPPVALTDGLLCEFEGLAFLLWKLKRTVWSKGKRSRNKASVGEPADGSLRCFYPILNAHNFLFLTSKLRACMRGLLLLCSNIRGRILLPKFFFSAYCYVNYPMRKSEF